MISKLIIGRCMGAIIRRAVVSLKVGKCVNFSEFSRGGSLNFEQSGSEPFEFLLPERT